MSLIMKKAQYNFVDVFDDKATGWVGHTRVRLVKQPNGIPHAYYVSGAKLERIRLIEIAKTLGK